MRLLPAALLLVLACGRSADAPGEAESPADGASEEVALPDTTTFVAFEGAGVPDWTPMRERGIGIVHLDPGPRLSGRAVDTLVARAEPRDGAQALARLVLDTTGVYRFEARPGLLDAPGALEFGYEEVGLPLAENGTDEWSRVHLGTRAEQPVTGWARQQSGRVGRTLWEDLLPGMPLFFTVPPDSVRFHDAPDGPAAPFDIPPPDESGQAGDYILWPLQRSGDWMQVRAVTPSDYCADPPAPREDTLWIRWRSARGNPRVWFFTRGC